MKQLLAVTICLLAAGTTFAQTQGGKKTGTKPKPKPKTEIEGYVRDQQMMPIAGVQAFVYGDTIGMLSTSGSTDASGHYETGYVGKGKYNLKFVYENGNSLKIDGVIVGKGITEINIRLNQPAADTTLPWTDFAPKPVEKKGKAKAK
jgi:hypothetical protein